MCTAVAWVLIGGMLFFQDPQPIKWYATPANIEEEPKRYLDRDVHLAGSDLSLLFRAMESFDGERRSYTTAQINGRGHVIGPNTQFVFLIPGQLQRNLLLAHPQKLSIHADIRIHVRKSTILTRGGQIHYVGEIISVVEVTPR